MEKKETRIIELKIRDDAMFYTKKDLDKAKEEGYRQGQADKVKDMVFKSKGKIPEIDYFLLEQTVERLDKLLKE